MNLYEQREQLEKQKKETEQAILDIEQAIKDFDPSDYITEDQYDEMLNDCHETVNICGYEYDPAYALQQIDPIAYRTGYNDYLDGFDLDSIAEYNDLAEELERLESELSDLDDELSDIEDAIKEEEEDHE